MSIIDIIAVLLTLSALLAYINHRFLGLPPTIGLMALTLATTVVIVSIGLVEPRFEDAARRFAESIDFQETVMQGILGFLLFAGALHVNLRDLARYRAAVLLLATVGVVISTVLVALLTWGLLSVLGYPISFLWCLIFGALISPTDPIAVMGLLKQMNAPHSLEIKIAGESLFNDGTAVVLFLGLLAIVTGKEEASVEHLTLLFLQEAIGGIAFGLVLGWGACRLLTGIDDYRIEVMLTLAVVAGGYALATKIHVSAPIAIVIAGLMIGNQGRSFAMSAQTIERLDNFWELIDEILNSILFVLIGLEVLILTFTGKYVLIGLALIPVVLFSRAAAVAIPIRGFLRQSGFDKYTVRILTWGGLRGGISVALALSLPSEAGGQPLAERDIFLAATYVIVVFSILVQGLTMKPLTRYWLQLDRQERLIERQAIIAASSAAHPVPKPDRVEPSAPSA